MTATVNLYQERSSQGPDGYTVLTRVDLATGIPTEIFVHRSSDETFSHVAGLDDFYWPVVKDITKGYYRKAEATKTYPDVRTAIDYAAYIKDRVTALLLVFETEILDFVGTETTVLPPGP